MKPSPVRPQDAGLTANTSTVVSGGNVDFTGPPGAEVVVVVDGQPGKETTFKIGKDGKASIEFTGPPRGLTIYLANDFDAAVHVDVVTAVR